MKFTSVLFLLILLLGCSQKQEKTSSLVHYIPDNASIVLKINDLDALQSELKNNEPLQLWKKSNLIDSISKQLQPLSYLCLLYTSDAADE